MRHPTVTNERETRSSSRAGKERAIRVREGSTGFRHSRNPRIITSDPSLTPTEHEREAEPQRVTAGTRTVPRNISTVLRLLRGKNYQLCQESQRNPNLNTKFDQNLRDSGILGKCMCILKSSKENIRVIITGYEIYVKPIEIHN